MLIILFSVVLLGKINAQFNCDGSVPNQVISMNSTPFETTSYSFSMANTGAGYLCCSAANSFGCQTFTINTHVNTIGIIFESGDYNDTVNIQYANCNTIYPLGSYICLTGIGPHEFSICSNSSTNFTLEIVTIGAPFINYAASTTLGCTSSIEALGLQNGSINIQSTSPGVPGNYNNLISCTSFCGNNNTFTPQTAIPSLIQYDISGLTLAPGCLNNTTTYSTNINLNVNPPLSISGLNGIYIVCPNDPYPTLTATLSGGDGNYNYYWSGDSIASGQFTNSVTVGIEGMYIVDAYDGTGCQLSQPVFVNSLPTPVASAGPDDTFCSPQNTISLNGTNSPESNATWSGGLGNFIPNNSLPITNYSPGISELTQGTIALILSSSNACGSDSDSMNVTFLSSSPLSLSFNLQDVSCQGGSNGQINISVTGGTGSYAYSWSNGATTEDLLNVIAGSYTVTVTDVNTGCVISQNISIQDGYTYSVGLSVNNVTCPGGNNGSVTSNILGGTLPFNYNWSNAVNMPNISNVTSGTYSVTVTDSLGCIATNSISVSQPNPINVSITATSPIICNGGVTNVVVSAIGGTSPYSGTGLYNSISAGIISYNVTDALGCLGIGNLNLTQPSPILLSLSPQNITCFGQANGSITANVTGGAGPYQYLWNNNATTATINNLSQAIYSLTLTDSLGCTSSQNTTISEPADLSVVVSSINATCQGANNGSASATVSGGTGALSYLWSTGATTASIISLTQGIYTLSVTDANGCIDSSGSTLVSEPVALSVVISSINVACHGVNNGSATANVSGATGILNYLWSTGATTASLLALAPGTYSVSVTDINGCAAIDSVTITQPLVSLALSTTQLNVLCNGNNTGSINITVTGGTSPYTYSWSNGSTIEDPQNLSSGTYSVTVTDANGCTAIDIATITQPLVALALSTTQVNVLCNGNNTGSINLTVTGGTSP